MNRCVQTLCSFSMWFIIVFECKSMITNPMFVLIAISAPFRMQSTRYKPYVRPRYDFYWNSTISVVFCIVRAQLRRFLWQGWHSTHCFFDRARIWTLARRFFDRGRILSTLQRFFDRDRVWAPSASFLDRGRILSPCFFWLFWCGFCIFCLLNAYERGVLCVNYRGICKLLPKS